MDFPNKRTFDQLEPLSREFSGNAKHYSKKFMNNHNHTNKKKRINDSEAKRKQQKPLGPISYQTNLLLKISNAFGKELSATLPQKLIEIYVPHSFANRNNQGIKKRKVFGNKKYLIRSDVFAIAVHSGKFLPETTKTNDLGIFLTLRFHYGTHLPARLGVQNGIRPMFAPQQKGLLVSVECARIAKSIKEISSLISIDQLKDQIINTNNPKNKIQNNENNLKNENENEKEKEKENENEKEEKQQEIRINALKKNPPKKITDKPLHNICTHKKKTNSFSVHKICFSLSNDPCLSYEFDGNFGNKLFSHLLTQVLYLETSHHRYELSMISKGNYKFARVKRPLTQTQRRMVYQKNIPLNQKNIEIIHINFKMDKISFNEQFAQFGKYKIVPKKFFFMKILN
ncbi:hypothetical protein M0812_00663 [Anaeramoeba flamelloides]|uniref:Uncharacterized protein n=1 Tax=Anaeramoeba flamelloides TaxID=1746091 RepID=A0AAV8A5Y5_9EUKA|nr:hypothetical protein M0812_00663 [Anaeramoeba flamelloides]